MILLIQTPNGFHGGIRLYVNHLSCAKFVLTHMQTQTCTLDILMHLPRSVLSHRQLDLFLWLLKVNDVDEVPSVKSMQTLNDMLQTMCGVDSIKYKGALGHTYYVNCLSQIIAQVQIILDLIQLHVH